MTWYVGRDGETFGPFTFEVLSDAARRGELLPTDLVWQPGMELWQPASTVAELWRPPPLPAPASVVQSKPSHDASYPDAPADVENGGDLDLETADQVTPDMRHASVMARPRQSFVLKHWKGDYSLGVAYWCFGLLLGWAVIIGIIAMSSSGLLADAGPRTIGLYLVTMVTILCSVSVWQYVGIWRSAGKHVDRGGRSRWAKLAKLAVLIGAAQAGWTSYTTVVPLLREGWHLIAGIDDIPSHEIRVLRQGQEVELAGGMPFGASVDLEKILAAAPTIKVIHLNSIGGRLGEGSQVAALIRKYQLVTFTAADCVSACTIAYIAGSKRYLAKTARLGFHSASLGGADRSVFPEINEEMAATLSSYGVPKWFVDKAINTPASTVWYPTHDELLRAQVVHEIVDAGDFGMSGIAMWYDQDALEKQLLTLPLYGALKEYEPKRYAELLSKFVEAVKAGSAANEVAAEINRTVMEDLVGHYLERGPDAALVRYWRSQIAEMEFLRRRDPQLCLQYIYPELRPTNFNLATVIPKELFNEDLNALAQLVRDTAKLTAAPEPGEPARHDLDAVLTKLQATDLEAATIVAEPDKFRSQPDLLCGSLIAFYSEVVSLPVERAGPVLRALVEPSSTTSITK